MVCKIWSLSDSKSLSQILHLKYLVSNILKLIHLLLHFLLAWLFLVTIRTFWSLAVMHMWSHVSFKTKMFHKQFAVEVFLDHMLLFHVLMQEILVFECFLVIKTAQAIINTMTIVHVWVKTLDILSEKTKKICIKQVFLKVIIWLTGFEDYSSFLNLHYLFWNNDNFNILMCRPEIDFFIFEVLGSATIFRNFGKFPASSWAFLELQQHLPQIFQTFQLLLQNPRHPS